MKKTLFVLLAFQFLLISCEKEHEADNHCAQVDAKFIPVDVAAAFETRYPLIIVEVWFNKDDNGYCAHFKRNGKEVMAYFKNNGSFVKEHIEDQQGDHQSDDDNEGCECEVDD